MEQNARDDFVTVVSIATLAYFVQDVLHEGLGHMATAWLLGAHKLTLSTVALQSDIDSRWIDAAGTLVNLAVAPLFWFALRPKNLRPATRYFFVFALAGNLFTGTGYFFYSGVADFGDWAGVIHELEPHWRWRLILIVAGAASYYASMLVVSAALAPFRGADPSLRRIRFLCWTPYFSEGALAAIAGLFNPLGLFYMISAGLASTLGANAGLFSMPYMTRPRPGAPPLDPIARTPAWIVCGGIAAIIFIVVLGRGMSVSR